MRRASGGSADCRAWLAAALIAGQLTAANAADWRITPRVSGEETWSDNIALAPSGAARSEFVTQVDPGVSVTGRGGRLQLFFDYQASLLHRTGDGSGTSIEHRMQSNGTAEFVKDLLFLDLNGVVGQRNTDNQGVQSSDLVSVNDNRNRFATFGASPYLRFRLSDVADAEARYRLDRVTNQGSVNSTLEAFSLSLGSGRRFASLPWSLSASSRSVDSSTGTASEFRALDGSLRYAFSRRYSVRVEAGYEGNDIQSTRGDTSGITWRASGIWQPTPRTSVEVGYGSRFFGESLSLNLSHRMRRAVFTASYSEDITTTAQEQAEAQLFPLQDAFGEDIEDPGLQRVDIPTNLATITDDVLVSRSFAFTLALRGRRTDGSLRLFDTRRSSESGRSADEKVFGLSASASRRLSRRTSLSTSGRWQRSDFGAGNEETLWSFDVRGSYRINADLAASVSYRHERNDGASAASDSIENRVSARVNVTF